MDIAARAGKVASGIKLIYGDLEGIARREINYYMRRPATSLIFLTHRCNSRCKTCTAWKLPAKEETAREIGFEKWKIIIDKLADAGVHSTEIFGGNVLLRKELLVSVLEYLYKKGISIHIPTNQIGLEDEVAEAIISYAHTVYLSIDGFGEYQDVIRGQKGASQRLETATEKLLRLKGGKKKPRIVCNTTVSKFNADALEQIVEHALAMGFDELHFEYAGEFSEEHIDNSLIEGLRPNPYFVKGEESILVDKDGAKRLKESIERIKARCAGSGINVTTINIDLLSEENIHTGVMPGRRCYIDRCKVTVDSAGNMAACPFIYNYVIGNLADSPFEQLWNNDKHRKFIKYRDSGKIKMCRHCILCVERNHGPLTAMKRVYLKRFAPLFIKGSQV